jgi:hypothetical protein
MTGRSLAIGPIAIELADRKNLAVERGHQNRIFEDLVAVVDLGKAEPQLARIIAFSERKGALNASPQNYDAAMPTPAFRPAAAKLLAVRASLKSVCNRGGQLETDSNRVCDGGASGAITRGRFFDWSGGMWS